MLHPALRWVSPGVGLWHNGYQQWSSSTELQGQTWSVQQRVAHMEAARTSRAASCLPAAGAMHAAERRVVPWLILCCGHGRLSNAWWAEGCNNLSKKLVRNALPTCWKTLFTKCNSFWEKEICFANYFFFVCNKASPYSLHLQHSVVSVKADDEAWVSKFLDRHKRLLGPQSARQAARIPLFSPDHPWAAPGLSGLSWVPRLLRQAAARSPSLYVVFHNQPKIPQHPRLGVAEKLNIAEIQLCEKAAGCGCSAPNQHMGLTTLHVLWSWNSPFPTSPICGIHCCRQDWLFLSAFCFLSCGTTEVSGNRNHFLPLPSN